MKISKRARVIIIGLLAIGAVVVLWCSDYLSKRDQVEQATMSAIQQASEAVQFRAQERQKIISQGSSLPFYAAKMSDPANQSAVLQEILYGLNEDSALPPLKMNDFRMSSTLSIDVSAEVEFITLFGIPKHTTLRLNLPLIPFKHQTGGETYPWTRTIKSYS
ncbi:hypothetical protein [Paenibacillus physcomitrellae]|nr:hypothetical protein [Paenibacillus physcomitrellae]